MHRIHWDTQCNLKGDYSQVLMQHKHQGDPLAFAMEPFSILKICNKLFYTEKSRELCFLLILRTV